MAEIGDITGAALALGDDEIIARQRRPVQTQDLDGRRRPGLGLVLPVIIDQRTHTAPFAARDKNIANAQRTALNEHGSSSAPQRRGKSLSPETRRALG